MPVLCFIDGEVIGSDDCLRKWAEREYNCRDYRPMALYSVIANDAYVNRMLEANVSLYPNTRMKAILLAADIYFYADHDRRTALWCTFD